MIARFVLDWASRPGPRLLLAEIRERTEAGRCGPRTKIELPLTADQRRQIGAMLEARWATGSEPVIVGRLRSGLAIHDVDLTELLESVGGPLRDRRAERAAAQRHRETELDQAGRLLRRLDPRVPEPVIRRCLVGAGPDWGTRARQIEHVVGALGNDGERLPVLAARLFGDSHALDRSRALGRAVARFLSGSLCEEAEGELGWQDPVTHGHRWREAWASRGVVCDEVSAHVLVLNLPLAGKAPAVQLAAVQGEPVWLTLRSLHGGVRLAPGCGEIFVCENPSVVEAAADRLGSASRPLVCTFGVPSQAATDLLTAIADQTVLRIRADEDRVGHRIVEGLSRLPNAQLWRMDSGRIRYEEEVLEDLLGDLDGRPASSTR